MTLNGHFALNSVLRRVFGALKHGFRSLATLKLAVNVVGELTEKRTAAASRGFLATARLSCYDIALWRHFSAHIFNKFRSCYFTNAYKLSLVLQNIAVLPICY